MVTLPSWEVPEGITIATDINSPVRRSDPEVVRRAAAERHLETLPTPTVTIWSDSSADSGTTNGGGGAVNRDRYDMWLRQSNEGVSARAHVHTPPLFLDS